MKRLKVMDFIPENMMNEQKLRQLFKNRSNCYADTWHSERGYMEEGDVIQTMDEDAFVKAVNEVIREQLLPDQNYWLMANTSLPVEDIVYFIENFKDDLK